MLCVCFASVSLIVKKKKKRKNYTIDKCTTQNSVDSKLVHNEVKRVGIHGLR